MLLLKLPYSQDLARRIPLIEGFVLWVALAYMCINALVDASYILLDPRLKRERA